MLLGSGVAWCSLRSAVLATRSPLGDMSWIWSGDCSGDVDGKSWQVCTPYSGDLKREAAEVAHGTS